MKKNKVAVAKKENQIQIAPDIKSMRKEFPKHLAKEVAKIEDVGTTVMQTSQQILLAVESILEEDFNFTEEDLWKVHRGLSQMLFTLAQIPDKGIFVLGKHDMENIKHMTEANVARIGKERLKELEPPKKKIELPEELKSK